MNKLKKYFFKHKSITAAVTIILIALITILILFVIIPRVNKSATRSTNIPMNLSKTNSTTSDNGTTEDLTAKAPSEGNIQYEFIRMYYQDGSNAPRYVYYTPEFLDDRLIQLNDQVIASLKQDGRINDQTIAYSISYFRDKTVAATYFERINDSKTTSATRLQLVGNYTAIMNFSTKPMINSLIKVSNPKILKQY